MCCVRVNLLSQNGEPGKETYVPDVALLQSSSVTRYDWIDYSVYDAEGTWLLYQKLKLFLTEMPWGQVNSAFLVVISLFTPLIRDAYALSLIRTLISIHCAAKCSHRAM